MVSEMEQDEVTILELLDVELAYGPDGPVGRGTLQVTSKNVIWKDPSDPSKHFEVEVPCITLHAISKDPSSFPKPCLYCQVCEDEEDEDETKEVYFVPQDSECLSSLFEAMSKAAMMNPDPPEPGEEEGDDELIFDQSGLAGITEEQARVLDHLDSILTISPSLEMGGAAGGNGQFDDADDEEDGKDEAATVTSSGENGHHDPAMEEEGN